MPKQIEDEFTSLPISGQHKWQLRKMRDGCCVICGKPAEDLQSHRCLRHLIAQREERARANNTKRRYWNCLSRRLEGQQFSVASPRLSV